MSTQDHFRFDHARHRAAADLEPEHLPDFQRLVKTLRFGSRFQLLIAEFNDLPYRDALIARVDLVLADASLRSTQLALTADSFRDFAAVEAELRRLALDHEAIHVTGGEGWFDEARWRQFNIRREAIAQGVPVRLILWLTVDSVRSIATLAPDLWAWRSGVFAFLRDTAETREVPSLVRDSVDPRSLAERSKRIAQLRAYLGSSPPPPDDVRLPLLDELATLLASIGQLDEALRIRREEELPVSERLGDVRSRAITLAKMGIELANKGDRVGAQAALRQALEDARRLQIPEAETIAKVMSELALDESEAAGSIQ